MTSAGGFARPWQVADVADYVRIVREVSTLDDLAVTLSGAIRRLGFDHYLLRDRGGSRLSDYPDDWLGLDDCDDALLAAAARSAAPFAWDELAGHTSAQRAWLAAAGARGMRGYTVPIHGPGGTSGHCSFVIGGGGPLPMELLPAALYLATFAVEAARRLAPPGPAPSLTPRQLDCVVLAAKGKSNWVAGQLLGVSGDTVHKYIESAKRRYGVSSRTELVVRTLYDGQLRFHDII